VDSNRRSVVTGRGEREQPGNSGSRVSEEATFGPEYQPANRVTNLARDV